MNSRAVAFGLLLIGALGMLITAGLPWYDAGYDVTFSGNDVTGGLAQALAVAVLAGVLLLLALRLNGRRIVAVLLAVIAAGAAMTIFSRPSSTEVMAEIRKHTLTDAYTLQATGAGFAYLAGCLVVIAGGAVVVLRAARWPTRAGRFERTAAEDDPTAIWKAIDAGEDPTDEPR